MGEVKLLKNYSMQNSYHNPFKQHKEEHFYIEADSHVKNERELLLIDQFSKFVLQEGYPCVGAQAAVNGKTFAIGNFDKMQLRTTPQNLAYGLMEYLVAMSNRPSNFLTYIAIFPNSYFTDEMQFEEQLWDLLKKLYIEDRKYFQWNPLYSQDPSESNFSFSFGEKGFFMVGMHPGSSRRARQFMYPSIAFNLQSQFDDLREKGRFDMMRDAIRERALDFQGSINPMLADYGEGLQAPQYSGRHVGDTWKCPFAQVEK